VSIVGVDGVSNTQNELEVSSRLLGFNSTTWDRLRAGITAVTATLTGWLNTLPWAIFHTTPATRTNTQGGPLEADNAGNLRIADQFAPQYEDNINGVAAVVHKPLAVSTYSPTKFQNLGANATLNVIASRGNVFSASCHNVTGANLYFQLHNTATVPAGAAVPALTILVPASGEIILGTDFFTQEGLNFATGIAFAISTTEATYTAAGATDHITHIFYV
jgi:hypothetical protein